MKFFRIFSENWGLKLVSLILAVIIYLVFKPNSKSDSLPLQEQKHPLASTDTHHDQFSQHRR